MFTLNLSCAVKRTPSFYESHFPIVDIDQKFFLREQTIADAEDFFRYYTDPAVSQHILATVPRDLEEARAEILYCQRLFAQQRGIYWALAQRENNRMVGAVGLYINTQHRRAELCYDLARSFWNQGLMTATLSRVLYYAFVEIGLQRVEAITTGENQASISLLKKLGFLHEGCLKRYRYFNGASHDVELFAITASQAEALHATQFIQMIAAYDTASL